MLKILIAVSFIFANQQLSADPAETCFRSRPINIKEKGKFGWRSIRLVMSWPKARPDSTVAPVRRVHFLDAEDKALPIIVSPTLNCLTKTTCNLEDATSKPLRMTLTFASKTLSHGKSQPETARMGVLGGSNFQLEAELQDSVDTIEWKLGTISDSTNVNGQKKTNFEVLFTADDPNICTALDRQISGDVPSSADTSDSVTTQDPTEAAREASPAPHNP